MNFRALLPLFLLPVFCQAGPLTDEQLLEKVRARGTALEEVTVKPLLLHSRTALLCRPPTPQETAEDAANPHVNKYSRLYVDKAGRAAAEGHEPFYPEGTVLLKEKLPEADDGKGAAAAGPVPELFTGMLKRAKGFNPDCGDWEFFTVSGDAGKLTSRGKTATCMECHQRYPDTDFTTRLLVPERRIKPGADGSLLLHSKDASVFGRTVRYEPQPHKNTLGFWTRKEDSASWTAELAPGRYEVEVLQGCGKGSGGADVVVEVLADGWNTEPQRCRFTVEDTGHFQNFKARVIGTVEVKAMDGRKDGAESVTVSVRPQSKPGVAVMDLRQIIIRPVK
jgi:Cytochrome P460